MVGRAPDLHGGGRVDAVGPQVRGAGLALDPGLQAAPRSATHRCAHNTHRCNLQRLIAVITGIAMQPHPLAPTSSHDGEVRRWGADLRAVPTVDAVGVVVQEEVPGPLAW